MIWEKIGLHMHKYTFSPDPMEHRSAQSEHLYSPFTPYKILRIKVKVTNRPIYIITALTITLMMKHFLVSRLDFKKNPVLNTSLIQLRILSFY